MKVCSRCQKEKKDSSYPNRSSICSACYVKAYRLNVKADVKAPVNVKADVKAPVNVKADVKADVKAPVNVKADVKAPVNVKADVKASGINWHPDDYQPCTDEEELLRRIELADREHRLLLKEKR